MIRYIAAAFGAVMLASAAHAGDWYFGASYTFLQAANAEVGTTTLAKSYPTGASARVGWQYDWYLAFEAAYQKSFGNDGAVHSNLAAPSAGLLLFAPKPLPKWLFVTGGVISLTAKSNLEISTPQADGTTLVTYQAYPRLTSTTWYLGGGVRYCDEWLCPRAEIGYRGSDIGGLYAGVGIDFKIP